MGPSQHDNDHAEQIAISAEANEVNDEFPKEAKHSPDTGTSETIDWRRRYEDLLEEKVTAEGQLLELYREIRRKQSELETANTRVAEISMLEAEIQQVRAKH